MAEQIGLAFLYKMVPRSLRLHETTVTATEANAKAQSPRAKVITGSFVLLSGSGLVTTINFAYNVAMARLLGPTGFGHATAVYTVLILMSAVTLSFQIVSAKLVAQQESLQAQSAGYKKLHRYAWLCGILVAALLVLFRDVLTRYLNLPSSVLIDLLAAGTVFYVPLGSRRGYIQGACQFRHLALNLIAEGAVRLGGSLLMIGFGYGVQGVIAANAAAVAVAYFLARSDIADAPTGELHIRVAFAEALQAIVFFAGQVIINNCDIVLVKHFFAPKTAGIYAAVALVGRVIFASSWAVISTMFPVVAGTRGKQKNDHGVLPLSLMLVLSIGIVVTLGLRLAPGIIWTRLFGSQFLPANEYSLSYLLSLYAAATTLYAICVVFIAYEMSYKIANTGWVQLAFSGMLIASIYRFHSSLEQVIWVQIVMMSILLSAVSVPFLRKARTTRAKAELFSIQEIRKIRPVTEDEVIAEFLKNDFHSAEFRNYHQLLYDEVMSPNLKDALENAKRRALLFMRHGSLWRELPEGTQWYQVEIRPSDLNRIRVFPRAHWRKLARSNFAATEVARYIAQGDPRRVAEEKFMAKIDDLCQEMRKGTVPGAVLLIGLNEHSPLTVLDGNHRLIAATLSSPELLTNLRFYCGFSPKMSNCCWYRTNLATLFHYGKNLVRHAIRDPETDLAQLLQNS